LSNGGLISGAFSSASGKADVVMNTNGQILYYNNGRKALDKEDNDDVLTLKSGLPSWEAVSAAGGGNLELIETKTATGSDTTAFDFTFADALDFSTDTAAMFFSFTGGTNGSTDVRCRLGDTTAGAVLDTNTYDKTQTACEEGTVSGFSNTGEANWDVAAHPAALTAEGFAGFGNVTTIIDSGGNTYLALAVWYNATLYYTQLSGKNTTATDGTLKYFNFYLGGSYFQDDSSFTCYKVKRA